jgi:NAD(P)-dependent dehydrogenase (short-subunit alcohol dehydrogenase family)
MASEESRVVAITGAASGIGRATALCFRKAGWRVVSIDRVPCDGEKNDQFITADVSRPADVESIFARIEQMAGRLDSVVNNAAWQLTEPLVTTTTDDWDSIMATNVRSVYLGLKFGAPLLRRTGGSVVNVSSVHAIATSSNVAAYAASKGAVLALTRAAAIELAPWNIRVNAILPGAVDTPMLHAALSERASDSASDPMATLRERSPMGRIGAADEIAEAILFLADNDRSRFITGQSLVVDGGALARLSTE